MVRDLFLDSELTLHFGGKLRPDWVLIVAMVSQGAASLVVFFFSSGGKLVLSIDCLMWRGEISSLEILSVNFIGFPLALILQLSQKINRFGKGVTILNFFSFCCLSVDFPVAP